MRKIIPILSICYVLYGLAMLAVAGFFVVLFVRQITHDPGFVVMSAEAFGIMMFGFLSLTMSVFAFLLSFMLLKRRNYSLVLILTSSLLLGFPVGTVLGSILLGVLYMKDIKREFRD